MNRSQKKTRLVQIELGSVLVLHMVLFLLGMAAWAGFLVMANDGSVPLTELEKKAFEPAGVALVLASILLPALFALGLVLAVHRWVVQPLAAGLKDDQRESAESAADRSLPDGSSATGVAPRTEAASTRAASGSISPPWTSRNHSD